MLGSSSYSVRLALVHEWSHWIPFSEVFKILERREKTDDSSQLTWSPFREIFPAAKPSWAPLSTRMHLEPFSICSKPLFETGQKNNKERKREREKKSWLVNTVRRWKEVEAVEEKKRDGGGGLVWSQMSSPGHFHALEGGGRVGEREEEGGGRGKEGVSPWQQSSPQLSCLDWDRCCEHRDHLTPATLQLRKLRCCWVSAPSLT